MQSSGHPLTIFVCRILVLETQPNNQAITNTRETQHKHIVGLKNSAYGEQTEDAISLHRGLTGKGEEANLNRSKLTTLNTKLRKLNLFQGPKLNDPSKRPAPPSTSNSLQ